jgi:K+-sensing histidine kinase KdpD
MSKAGPTFRYALAILAAMVALFLRGLLTPLLGNHDAYHTVWLAVVFSAWYCGLGPSIVATVVSALGVWYLFLPPSHSWAIRDRADVYGLLGFCVFSGAIIALGGIEPTWIGSSASCPRSRQGEGILRASPQASG